MAISLNNHESRIKALETGGSSTWTKGSNSNGNWVKENTTGLIIQFGSIPAFGSTGSSSSGSVNVSLPISFSNELYSIATSDWCNQYTVFMANVVSKSVFECYVSQGQCYLGKYLAIGYLISDRILKYAYACKSLLFTPLRKIGGVK